MSKHKYWCKTLMYHAVMPKKEKPSSYYHAIYTDELRKQLKATKRFYNFIHPDEFAEIVRQNKPLPSKSILLTFDDGYQNNIDLALPILEELNIPALVFFNTINLNQGKWLWFNRLKAMQQRGLINFEVAMQHTKDFSIEEIHYWLDNKINAVDVADGTVEERIQLNGSNLVDLKNAVNQGFIIPGGHTHAHAKLINETPESLAFQIKDNKEFLEKTLGRSINLFAYPEGLVNDQVANAVKEAGYTAAFTVNMPTTTVEPSLSQFYIPRIGIFRGSVLYHYLKLFEVKKMVTGRG